MTAQTSPKLEVKGSVILQNIIDLNNEIHRLEKVRDKLTDIIS